MKRMITVWAVLNLVAWSALANPVQIGNKGSAAQVYGDGSAASASHSNAVGVGIGQGGAGGKATGGKASVTVNITDPAPSATAGHSAGGSEHSAKHASASASDRHGSGGGSDHGTDFGHIPVATAAAPAIMSVNPCSGSPTSAGLQSAPFGLSFGTGGDFDNACRLHMLGQDAAAVAYLCRDDRNIRRAFADIGQPCPQDRPQVETIAAPPPVAALPSPNQRYRYDWCYTMDNGSGKQHKVCAVSGR